MQTDPNEPAQEKDFENARHCRAQQIKICVQFMQHYISKNVAGASSDIGVVLSGDLSCLAELDTKKYRKKEKVVSDTTPTEEIQAETNSLDEIINNINSQALPLIYVEDVYNALRSFGFSYTHLPTLRARVEEPRHQQMAFIAMAWLVIEEEIQAQLSIIKTTQSEAKIIFFDTLLHILRLLLGSPNLESKRALYSNGDADKEHSCFWIAIHKRLVQNFGDGLTPQEKSPENFSLQASLHLLKYQLVKLFESHAMVQIKPTAKTTIFLEEHPVVTANDVGIIFSESNTFWTKFLENITTDAIASEANIPVEVGQLLPTQEYKDMMEAFGAIDVYRHRHADLAGWTVLGSHNSLVPSETKKRQDYTLLFPTLPSNPNQRLLNMKCMECDVVPFGDKPDEQLSSHFALQTNFGLWLR